MEMPEQAVVRTLTSRVRTLTSRVRTLTDTVRTLTKGVCTLTGSVRALTSRGTHADSGGPAVQCRMITRGIRADAVIREVAALAGGRGGGKPHMAQAGVGEPDRIPEALGKVVEIVRPMLAKG